MKTRAIILTVLSVLFGLMMANSGLDKFLHFMPIPEMPQAGNELMAAFVNSNWLMELVGIVEITGGILFAIPKTRALGAIVILPVIIGIMLFQIFMSPTNIPIGAILLAINIAVIYENKSKYTPMVQ